MFSFSLGLAVLLVSLIFGRVAKAGLMLLLQQRKMLPWPCLRAVRTGILGKGTKAAACVLYVYLTLQALILI